MREILTGFFDGHQSRHSHGPESDPLISDHRKMLSKKEQKMNIKTPFPARFRLIQWRLNFRCPGGRKFSPAWLVPACCSRCDLSAKKEAGNFGSDRSACFPRKQIARSIRLLWRWWFERWRCNRSKKIECRPIRPVPFRPCRRAWGGVSLRTEGRCFCCGKLETGCWRLEWCYIYLLILSSNSSSWSDLRI